MYNIDITLSYKLMAENSQVKQAFATYSID